MTLKKFIAFVCLVWAVTAHAFAPQSGTWIIDSELDGKPGRGLAIDVQNATLLMQMYAYEPSGEPTFYLAVGQLANNQATTPLTRYVGGRYLGSGPMSGRESRAMGSVKFRFTSGATGFITLPGEAERAISRFNFGYPAIPVSLRGLWIFTSLGSDGLLTDAANLTQVLAPTSTGNGIVASSDGRFGCEHQTSGALVGGVLCVKIDAQGQLARSYLFAYVVNDGEGYSQRGGSGPDQTMTVRRMTTPQGVGTGLVFKDEDTSAENPTLRFHLGRIANQGN